jgi:hypothetical protein
MQNIYYVYIYLDPRKQGNFYYQENNLSLIFNYEPFYVGAGKNKRLYDHLQEAKRTHKNSYKINKIKAILNLGYEPIIYKLCENMSFNNSRLLEKYICKIIGRNDLQLGPLTNLTDGGEGVVGCKNIVGWATGLTKETDKRIEDKSIKVAQGLKKYYKTHSHHSKGSVNRFTEETLNKMSKAKLNKPGNRKGKKNSAEHNYKMAQSKKGKKQTKESNKKRSTTLKTTLKLKKEQITEPIIQYSLNNEYLKEYKNYYYAQWEYDIQGILQVLKGKRKSCGGFIWKYKKDI